MYDFTALQIDGRLAPCNVADDAIFRAIKPIAGLHNRVLQQFQLCRIQPGSLGVVERPSEGISHSSFRPYAARKGKIPAILAAPMHRSERLMRFIRASLSVLLCSQDKRRSRLGP